MGRIVQLRELERIRRRLRRERRQVVFTNGTFDLLHRGHAEYLAAARACGDVLVVGLNTDASIRRIKGPGRPINGNRDRAAVLAALASVDYVCLFGDDTPERLIRRLRPDVLVKGADWKKEDIVGGAFVEQLGGRVERIRLTAGRSTTGMIRRILAAYGVRNARIPDQPQRRKK
jgi:D-beta-D-heptose 7-phosphate kinase/D-beta-D-heptose 1-phosphate adenosyltransferase